MRQGIDPLSPLPRYYQIYSALLDRIQSGALKPGTALPAERQIAEDFGVARLTVVKALDLLERDGRIERQHGRGTFVTEPPETEVAFSNTIAFISSPTISYDLMMGISRTAFKHQFHLQIMAVDFEFKHLQAYLDACLASDIQGFLIFGRPGNQDVKLYQKILDADVPLVLIDRYFSELACDYVVYNNADASQQLTEKLLAKGHRHIAIIPGSELETTAVQDRLLGYRLALEAYDIPYDEDLVWLDLYDSVQPEGLINNHFRDQLKAKLELYQISALVTINDQIAHRVSHDLLMLQRSELLVNPPNRSDSSWLELEIATFSEHMKPVDVYINVVAVHPTMALGQAAAKLLIDRLNGAISGSAKHEVIPMTLVELPSKVRQTI